MSSRAKIVEDFNKFLDKATDPMLLEPDDIAVAEVCRMVDDFVVEPSDAIQAIHGKILDENPHTVYYALTVLNSVFYKCGNIVHSVIVTPQYMELVKDIIQTTEHKKIKEKIISMLEDWADKFKYLPNYCAVQVLLEELNGRNSKENCRNLKTEKLQDNNGNNPFTTCQNSVADKEMIKDNNNCIESDLNMCTDEELGERGQEYKRQLKVRQDKLKQEYKLHRKALKLPTSSDEEDLYLLTDGEDKKQEFNDCKINSSGSKQEEEWKQKSIKLPKDLEKQKTQRLKLNAEVKKVCAAKHENFRKDQDNHSLEMRQCMASDCKNCESYKNKNREEENIVIPKQLTKDMKKVKESRQLLNHSLADYRVSKKQEYYKKYLNNGLDSAVDYEDKNVPVKSIETEEEKFQRELQTALLLSQQVDIRDKSLNVNISEENNLGEARALHNSQTMDPAKDEADLQEAINLSFIESEEQNFSSMPKLDEDLQLCLAKQLSLDEIANLEKVSDCNGSKKVHDICVICYEIKPVKKFAPCNHRCICHDCTLTYPLDTCPLCLTEYVEIVSD